MSNVTQKAKEVLLETVVALEVRSEIEDCLRDVVTDVEMAVHIEERLRTHHEIRTLQSKIAEYEYAIAEANAIREQNKQRQSEMADALLQELIVLSDELGQLQETKRKHETLLVQYDEILAKLVQTEESLQIERETREMLEKERPQKPETEVKQQEEQTPENMKEDEKQQTIGNESSSEKSKEEQNQQQDHQQQTQPDILESSPSSEKLSDVATSAEIRLTTSIDDEKQQLVAIEEDEESQTPTLDQFDTEILMNIFAFLDAMDILNTAQINVSMYSRVDSLFGLGAEESAPTSDNSTIATTETATAPAATTTSNISQPTMVTLPPPPVPTPSTVPVPSKPANTTIIPQATIVTPPPQIQSKPAPVKTAPPPSTSTAAAGSAATSSTQPGMGTEGTNPRGIFSLLQPRRSAPSSPAHSLHQRSNSAPMISEEIQPMTAAMANSMAAKLSDAELNAIILMRERLEQKKQQAEKLMKENQELLAKLEGTENVKQFLIAKVRDMEVSLSSSVENEVKVALQIASDQEVIAFLDGRVQELEREARVLREEKEATQKELERVQQQSEQKSKVMGDMLQFEREKLKDNEREWKVTKKVLIKEVKNCRAQIMALQAERDGYREQNEILRKAVMNSPNGSRDRGVFSYPSKD
jgi:hypothetical protein